METFTKQQEEVYQKLIDDGISKDEALRLAERSGGGQLGQEMKKTGLLGTLFPEGSIRQNIGREIVRTPFRAVENVRGIGTELGNIGRIATGRGDDIRTTDPRFSEFLGEEVRPLEGLREGVGFGLELSSYLPIAGAIGTSASLLRGAPILRSAATIAAEGALGGGLFESGRQVQEREFNPLDIAKAVVAGGAFGVVLGGAGALASPIIRRGLDAGRRTLSDFMNPVVPPSGGAGQSATQLARETAEASAPSLTLGERTIGITPDVKGRFQEAGEDLMRQYIDVAKTRNVTDTIIDASGNRIPAPTPYGFGAEKTHEVANILQQQISETGSVIGQTRQRLSTYRANIDQMNSIENKLISEIEALKLTVRVKDGKVVRTRGIQTVSDGDIRAIQTILDNLRVVKESQNLTDLIDFRSAVDQNIKFGKRSSEVSDAVDSLSLGVRREVADVAAKIVGKTEASELAKYSDFMDAFTDLRSFTDKRAGGEYLLRLLSSGRGDEARRLVETIRQYTGVDLMNDATLMVKVTDLIGNDAQKNLFRQEITKAQLDVQAILSGSPTSMTGRAIDRTIDFLTDEEQILINASRKTPDTTTPLSTTPTGLDNTQGGFLSLGGFADDVPSSPPKGEGVIPATNLETQARSFKTAEEFVAGIKPKDYLFKDSFGGTLSAEITGNRAMIGDAFAKEAGHGVYKNAIDDLANRGITTVEIPLQSVDSQGAINSLVKSGVLTNPRGGDPRVVGGGYKTIFDIPSAKTKSQLTSIWEKANQAKPTGLNNTQGGFISLGGFLGESPEAAFKNFSDLSTKLLGKLEGRTTVSKQFISDLTNSPDLKQAERDLFREILKGEGDTVNVQAFADKVKTELLPLKRTGDNKLPPKYEGVSLPSEIRGNVANYNEHIYRSPIKTSAGRIHFDMFGGDDYFAHTRIEDLSTTPVKRIDDPFSSSGVSSIGKATTGDTRRVIELQSDLFQKGRLESEKAVMPKVGDNYKYQGKDWNVEGIVAKEGVGQLRSLDDIKQIQLERYNGSKLESVRVNPRQLTQFKNELTSRQSELSKLEPYRNTWQERIIREEVKQAAIDGKTKLQFPTGETALKIEGIGERKTFTFGGEPIKINELKVGREVKDRTNAGEWTIVEVGEGGQFKAAPTNLVIGTLKQKFPNIPSADIISFMKNCL